MNKFNSDKVQKETLKLCKEIAESREYITAPLTVYQEIRTQFTKPIHPRPEGRPFG